MRDKIRDLVVKAIADPDKLTEVIDSLLKLIEDNNKIKKIEIMKLKLKHIIGYANHALFGEFLWKKDIVTAIDFEHSIISSLNNGSVLIEDFKPILHPLSDLTKEIEHNGEKFVPREEIIRLGFKYLRPSNMENTMQGYYTICKLFEWHFDVFNLIENNLAIDINTL